MADWIFPDGFTDISGSWTDESLAYDGDTGTYAWVLQNSNAWGNRCNFTFSTDVTNCTKIRIWISSAADADIGDLDVRVYDGIGGSEIVISSKKTEGQYVEANVTTCHTVNYMDIRFGGLTAKYGQHRLHEIQVYGDGGPTGSPPSSFASGAYFARRIIQLG